MDYGVGRPLGVRVRQPRVTESKLGAGQALQSRRRSLQYSHWTYPRWKSGDEEARHFVFTAAGRSERLHSLRPTVQV